MKRFSTPTFFKFLLGFVGILAVAFVAMVYVAHDIPASGVDNSAQAQ
ncbi:MAG TPA: hypothetical protein VG984_00170 [Candidatus Paceibacterota bacterium]|nr:hypothetical protein [Candidatus Paceibacterota bacterium]